MVPSHYLNQCWLVVNWTLGNKFQWNPNQNTNIFIEENEFQIVVCKILLPFSAAYDLDSTQAVIATQVYWVMPPPEVNTLRSHIIMLLISFKFSVNFLSNPHKWHPVRASYGVCIVSLTSDLGSISITLVLCVLYFIGPCCSSTQPYMFGVWWNVTLAAVTGTTCTVLVAFRLAPGRFKLNFW